MAAILSSLVCPFFLPLQLASHTPAHFHLPPFLASPYFVSSHHSSKYPGVNVQLINQNAHPSFPPHPSLTAPKFLISVGGFLPVPKEPSLSHLFPLPASLPTLHIVGRNDIVVTEEKSRTLWEKCENSRVEYHDGGESPLSLLSFVSNRLELMIRPLHTIQGIMETLLQVSYRIQYTYTSANHQRIHLLLHTRRLTRRRRTSKLVRSIRSKYPRNERYTTLRLPNEIES